MIEAYFSMELPSISSLSIRQSINKPA